MKKVKMLQTVGVRKKGHTYDMTSRAAEMYIFAGFATDPDAPKEVKENKQAKGRNTK